MKLQHKLALLIFAIGIVFTVVISSNYYYRSHNLAVTNAQSSLLKIAEDYALYVEKHLEKDAHVTSTLTNAPIIEQALIASNSEFDLLNEEEKEQKISSLNKKWVEMKDVNDPFIQGYMTNPVAAYLKKQQEAFPAFYGEIFLTNRYGVIIATTRKLTTLAHAHKYWWKGSYYKGNGRIFFDDRGYDLSVGGYVLGVVVPVKNGDELIGIMKCNIKILGSYSRLLNEYTNNNPGKVSLVRSKGLVVFEKDVEPLSRKVPGLLIEEMKSLTSSSLISTLDGSPKKIISCVPIPITIGSEKYGFGGKYKSLDQINGNLGERWFIISSRDFQQAVDASTRLTRGMILSGFILVLFMALSAMLVGKKFVQPVLKLAKMSKEISRGDFKAEIEISSKDELGDLASSFNKMNRSLRETMISRDKLLEEIDLREEAEKLLKENEVFMTTVLDNLPIGVAVNSIDSSITFNYMNDNFPMFYRTTRDELEDPDAFWDAVYEDPIFREKVKKRVLDDCSSGDPRRMHWEDIPIARKGKNDLFISAMNTPVPNKKLVISTVWDVTERKQAQIEKENLESRLRQAHKMEAIGTLAGGIAHDFNNILGAIIGYTEMAKDGIPEESIAAKDLEKVLESSSRAAELVKQILAFSRQDETERVLLQPASIVSKAVAMLRPTIPTTIKITQDIDTETGLIFADPTQIHQVIMNLYTNAFHAMEERGGRLDISLNEIDLCREDITFEPRTDSGTFIQLSVRDSGSGMAQEVKDKIFDPYFTTKDIGKGTGMGLSIVHGIVKSYGGFITISSELGKGTTFHVFLPVVSEDVLLDEKVIKEIPVGMENILFIDDEDLLADMGGNMLERLGYHVTVRNNSLEALETFQNQPDQFDVIITDQTMPGMTGVDLARRMLQIRPDIPVILCTGYSSIVSEEKAKSMGIKGFALKPVSNKDIAVLIRKVLDT